MIGPQSRVFIVLLGALMMVNALSIDMTLPALPAIGQALDATPDWVQLTLSLYLVGYAAGQFVVGPLADRFGRRRVLLSGLSIYMLATVACALSRRIDVLLIARVVQGTAACGGPVVVRAIVRDHVGGDRAAHMMSSLTTVFALGPLGAPIIGGWLLVRWGWASIFFFIAAWTAVLVLAAWTGLEESLKQPDREALRLTRLVANYRTFLTTRTTIGFAFVNGMCWVGIFAFLSASPFVFVSYYGVAPDHYGYYFALLAVTLVVGASTNKRLLRRMPGTRVLRFGFVLLVAGGVAMFVIPLTPLSGPLTLMIGFVIYCFGQTLVMPNAVAAALEPLKHMAGTGSALLGIVQMLCGAAGGYVVNAFYDGTPVPMGTAILIAAIACALLYRLVVQPRALRPAA
jgi:MFS transporter, DHA1 family, multidrug resistance protein